MRNEPTSPRATGRYRKRLSLREITVLQAVAHGATTVEAAATAGIDEHQARYSLRTVNQKLTARTREQAVAVALQRGLIDTPPPPGQ